MHVLFSLLATITYYTYARIGWSNPLHSLAGIPEYDIQILDYTKQFVNYNNSEFHWFKTENRVWVCKSKKRESEWEWVPLSTEEKQRGNHKI